MNLRTTRAVILCAAFLASSLLLVLGQEKGPNMLTNPGFEQIGPNAQAINWVFTREGGTVVSPILAHDGKALARVRFDDRATQTVPCTPGRYYSIDGWVCAENPETRELPRVKVYFLRGDGSEAVVTGGTVEKPGIGKWERFSIPVRTPYDAETVQVALIGAFGGQDWFLFDDLVMTVAETPKGQSRY